LFRPLASDTVFDSRGGFSGTETEVLMDVDMATNFETTLAANEALV